MRPLVRPTLSLAFAACLVSGMLSCASRITEPDDPFATDDMGGVMQGRCPEVACGAGSRCFKGACVPDLGPCGGDDECQNDSFCDAGRCTPYGPRTKQSD